MDDSMKQIMGKTNLLVDQLAKLADDNPSARTECQDLKDKSQHLAALLRQAAKTDLYSRPARRIMSSTEQVLDKALALVKKSRGKGIFTFFFRLFNIVPTGSFRKMSVLLGNSIGDLSWLLRVSAPDDDGDMLTGLPPIAQNEPILFLIWAQIANLHHGSLTTRSDAAASLVSLARGNEHYAKLIVDEDGVAPLLRLLKEGRIDGQENAARALGLLGRDPASIEQMSLAGICSVFSQILKEGPMNVQAIVAWAISELAANHPNCQDVFAQNNVVRLLVGHLAFETVQEHSRYSIPSKITSIHNAANVMDTLEHPVVRHPMGEISRNNVVHSTPQTDVSLSGTSIKRREFEDPATKAYLKAMAARALWHLARDNAAICKSISESKALLCFAVLLEKGDDDVRYNSAMALMEIARMAEADADLRRFAFKPNSPTCRSVVDQLLRIVEKAEYDDLLVPCIAAIGCLSRTFRATETRIIRPLVRLLEEREAVVTHEALLALTKFACTENYLHVDHSKAIIEAGGVKNLVQLIYFGEQLQIAATILLSYIACNVPTSEVLADSEVLTLLEWASKQPFVAQASEVDIILQKGKGMLELYQTTGSRGYH